MKKINNKNKECKKCEASWSFPVIQVYAKIKYLETLESGRIVKKTKEEHLFNYCKKCGNMTN